MRPIGKVNKGPSALWWPNFENVKKQKMGLITILIIPENMNPPSPCIETQWSFVKFVKILKNSLIWTFLAIMLALGQENPNFLHFLNPCKCFDVGQWKKVLAGDQISYLTLSNRLKVCKACIRMYFFFKGFETSSKWFLLISSNKRPNEQKYKGSLIIVFKKQHT